jgi:hypothetical protein
MKTKIAIFTLMILSASALANSVDFSNFLGNYKLVKTGSGTCAPDLRIEEEDLKDQKTTHSLSIYAVSPKLKTTAIYQLTALNSGVDFHYTTTGMFGQIDGTFYSLQTLKNDHLSADNIVRNVLGFTLSRTTLDAEMKGNHFTFTKTSYYSSKGSFNTETDNCTYLKD